MNKLLIVKHHENYDNTDDFFCREVIDSAKILEYFESIKEEMGEQCSEINENFDIIIIDLQNNNNIITTYKDLIRAGFEQILKGKNNG